MTHSLPLFAIALALSSPAVGQDLAAILAERVGARLAVPRLLADYNWERLRAGRIAEIAPPLLPGLGLGCCLMDFESVPKPQGLIELYGGTDAFGVALSASRLELCHLKPNAHTVAGDQETDTLEILPEDIAPLRGLLTTDSSVEWEEDSDRTPHYTHRVKFCGPDSVVIVDLCFGSETLRVVRDGREVATTNFRPTAEVLHLLIDRSEAWTKLKPPE